MAVKGIQFGGYLISLRNGHVQIRIDDETYRQHKAHYIGLALRRTKDTLSSEFPPHRLNRTHRTGEATDVQYHAGSEPWPQRG
jgi:hypothetical protein